MNTDKVSCLVALSSSYETETGETSVGPAAAFLASTAASMFDFRSAVEASKSLNAFSSPGIILTIHFTLLPSLVAGVNSATCFQIEDVFFFLFVPAPIGCTVTPFTLIVYRVAVHPVSVTKAESRRRR